MANRIRTGRNSQTLPDRIARASSAAIRTAMKTNQGGASSPYEPRRRGCACPVIGVPFIYNGSREFTSPGTVVIVPLAQKSPGDMVFSWRLVSDASHALSIATSGSGSPPGPVASAPILLPVRLRVKKLKGLVAPTHVHCRHPGLPQNPGRQVATLSHLAVHGDLPVVGQFAQAGAQLIDWNVHGVRDMPGGKLLGRAHVQQEGRWPTGVARTASTSSWGWSPRSRPPATKPAL